jgi:hypothetical protein
MIDSQPLADGPVCDYSLAQEHHPYECLPVSLGFADPVQPDLDHDQGWAG